MLIVNFELLEEVKTGNRVDAFFGTKEETKDVWVQYSGIEVLGGSGTSESPLLILMPDGDPAWLDINTFQVADDGVMDSSFSRLRDEWQDMRNFKLTASK